MKTTKSVQVANQVQALFYDGNTPIGQLGDGREVVLSAAQVKLVMRKLTAVTEQRDRLAEALERIRAGYGGQVVCPDCRCDDCAYLRPIDAALQYLKQTTEP